MDSKNFRCLYLVPPGRPKGVHNDLPFYIRQRIPQRPTVAGWWATGWLSRDEFSVGRPESLTFSGPLARIGHALMTGETTGAIFGPAVVLAAAAGAAMSAAFARQLRWIAPRRDRIFAMLAGGGLMGLGSVLAGGCNIGQGMSGVSTLSTQSFLATAAMLAGVRFGVMWLAGND